jgi:Tol biopolymer transport system component
MQGYKSSLSTGTRLVLTTVVIAVLISAFGIYVLRRRNASPPSFENAKASKLTTSGNVVAAAISADAQVFAYVTSAGDKQTVFLKPVAAAAGKSVELIGPVDANYHGLTLSPDANFIYFVRSTPGASGSIHRLPLRGGPPVELFREVNSTACLSPDGQLLAYLRAFPEQKETALIIGRTDGTGERKLAVLKEPNDAFVMTGGPSWSSNGKLIATATVNQGLVAVSATDGALRPIGNPGLRQVGRVAWMADGKSLLITANDQESQPTQVWQLTYPSGASHRITNDPNAYRQLSLSKDSRQLLALQIAVGSETGDVVLIK